MLRRKAPPMNIARSSTGWRTIAGVLGAAMLVAVGVGTASAAEEGIGIGVEIDEAETGALSMTVDTADTVQLVEDGSTGTERQFVGSLPDVTVTDTRDPSSIPEGAYWYVTGSVTDFVGDAGQADILASESFGWSPRVVSGETSDVAVGDDVVPGEGFSDFELFASTFSSADAGPGTWVASADLTLRTDANVEPGSYSSTLTLGLFED